MGDEINDGEEKKHRVPIVDYGIEINEKGIAAYVKANYELLSFLGEDIQAWFDEFADAITPIFKDFTERFNLIYAKATDAELLSWEENPVPKIKDTLAEIEMEKEQKAMEGSKNGE